MDLLPINTRVKHSGHGPGTIVEYNGIKKSSSTDYLFSQRGATALGVLPKELAGSLVNSLYNGERYPYVVKFDSGYKDVYSKDEITELEEGN